MKRVFHPGLSLLVRIVLGGIILYASWHKIEAPPKFANIVYNYKLFPAQAINLIAIFVPWLEVFTGLSLISGVGRRAAALLVSFMLTGFIIALGINLHRDCPTICGCFSSGTAATTDAEKFAEMWQTIWRDVGLLLLALHVMIASFINPRK